MHKISLLKLLLVVFGFGSQTFICGFSRQNICSAGHMWMMIWTGCRPTGRMAAGSRPTVECIFRGAVLMYRAWGMKDEEIYEEVNAKHRKAKLTL